MSKIIWDEDEEFSAIEHDGHDDCPESYIENGSVSALITGKYDFKFEEPVWMPNGVSYELQEAGIFEMHDSEAFVIEDGDDSLHVYLYTTV